MKIAYLTRLSCVLSFAVLGAVSYGFAAQAEPPTAAALTPEASIDTSTASLPPSAPTALMAGGDGTIAQSPQPEPLESPEPRPQTQPVADPGADLGAPSVPATPESSSTEATAPSNQAEPETRPETAEQQPSSSSPEISQETTIEPLSEQRSGFSPGRATRSGPSYIGVGANIGLGDGDTALGEGSFAAFSKVGLTRDFSVRPSILINDNPTILLPITLDFIPGITPLVERVSTNITGLRVSPFVGAGIAISTGDGGGVDFLTTGGFDVPLSSRITATAAVNASLFDNPAVGLTLGVGYNF